MSSEKKSQKDLHKITKEQIVPSKLSGEMHKGQQGRIAVIGGSRNYTGAPYYAAFSALKMGADLAFVFCEEAAAIPIKSYSPELMVHPLLKPSKDIKQGEEDKEIKEILAELEKVFPRLSSLVVGPGLGRDEFILKTVKQIIEKAKEKKLPMVVDGDALQIVMKNADILKGYGLAILTPNANELKGLRKELGLDEKASPKEISSKLGGVVVMEKAGTDLITNGDAEVKGEQEGSPRRCGGQGDILAGLTATALGWTKAKFKDEDVSKKEIDGIPAVMLAAWVSSTVVRKSANRGFIKHGRSMTTVDIIQEIGAAMDELYPLTKETKSKEHSQECKY